MALEWNFFNANAPVAAAPGYDGEATRAKLIAAEPLLSDDAAAEAAMERISTLIAAEQERAGRRTSQ